VPIFFSLPSLRNAAANLSFPSFSSRQAGLIELIGSLAKARSDLKYRQTKLKKSEGDLLALRTELEAESRTLEERTEGAVSLIHFSPSSISLED